MLYPNLEAEMKRNGVKVKDLAEVLKLDESGAYKILKGTRSLSIFRAREIRDNLFPGVSLEYLFDYAAIPGESKTA